MTNARHHKPLAIDIIEVGPRDGLQGLAPISTTQRLALVALLTKAGLSHIEVGALVSPQRIPAMAESDIVLSQVLKMKPESPFIASVLVPNMRGAERAIALGAKHLAIFTAVSDTFCQKNIHCSLAQSLARFYPIIELAKRHQITVRGYLSCITDCPFEGAMSATKTASVANALYQMGCDEISLGDTLGKATPTAIERVLSRVLTAIPAHALAGHYHDTYGMALVNVARSIEMGLTRFDTSAGGLGGCPYAPGAAGNLATETLAWYCQQEGIATGVNVNQLKADITQWKANIGITSS
uniref:hydroxymethylglutaryl-CoA lyase n=1 Tax=Thaumasiovibrio occultus TaxID=1891184 RepID=UPI00131E9865|nr:hydroxymethylglutaryl-CoA lyase [Thaumasiovibrio occultus]